MLACKRRCRRCFPNGCCGFCRPPPQVQKQVDTVVHLKKAEEKTEIPYGHIDIYPGVRTSDNKYTCPMLAVHLYKHSKFHADMGQDNRSILIDNKNRQQTHQGAQQLKQQEELTAEETILMIPVEDVTQINSKAEMKMAIQADLKSTVTPVYAESENCCDRCLASVRNCCASIRKCCHDCCGEPTKVAPLVRTTTIFTSDNPNRDTAYKEEHLPVPKEEEDCRTRCCNPFRCWCCRKKKLVDLIKRTNTVEEREAQRVITVTIEYSKYSNLDTPSNTRLLSQEEQLAHFKKKFNPDTKLQFYLTNDTEIHPNNFEVKRKQAETLCRTVMQLKGMRDHYPSENALDNILDLGYRRTFGDAYQEPVLALSFRSATTGSDSQRHELPRSSSRPAIQQQLTTTDE